MVGPPGFEPGTPRYLRRFISRMLHQAEPRAQKKKCLLGFKFFMRGWVFRELE